MGFAGEGGTVQTIPTSDEYLLQTWSMEEGMPYHVVQAISQTRDGYLWLATPRGVARFDGNRFSLFFKGGESGLESNHIETEFVSKGGDLWLGLDRGLVARWNGYAFKTVAAISHQRGFDEWVCSLCEDAAGEIWCGIRNGSKVVRIENNGALTEFGLNEGGAPGGDIFVCADIKGQIWYANAHGCGVFEQGRFQSIDDAGGDNVHLALAREGGVWAVRAGELIHYDFDGTKKSIADIRVLGEARNVNVLYEDRYGALWLGTRNAGLYRFSHGEFVRVPTSFPEVRTISEDREGNLWVGTYGGGVDRLSRRGFWLKKMEDGLLEPFTVSFCEDGENRLWIAGRLNGPVRATDSANRSFAAVPGWPGGLIYALCADSSGGVWLAGSRGLRHWSEGNFSTVPSVSRPVTALLTDKQKNLWIAPIHGELLCLREGRTDQISEPKELSEVRSLAQDTGGRIWAGTENGRVFFRESSHFISVDLPEAKDQVRFIVPDRDDTVWIGVYGAGLYRYHAGRVCHWAPDSALGTDEIRSLVIDNDDFWIATGCGIFQTTRRELKSVMDEGKPFERFSAHDRKDGVPVMEYAYGFRNAAMRAHDGHLWFASGRGALEIDPENLKDTIPMAAAQIDAVQIGTATVPSSSWKKLIVPSHPGLLQISYTMPELRMPSQVRFRYRLIGAGKDDWIRSGSERTATFAHLGAGEYRFEVAAARGTGSWLPKTASLSFTVLPAWWETAWFRLAAFTSIATAGALLVRFVVSRRIRGRMLKLQHEHALERERTRIARDMHDELGADLTQISLVSKIAELESPENMSTHVREIASVARHAVESLDEIVWAVNPRHDTLSSLVDYLGEFASAFLRVSGLSCKLAFPENLPGWRVSSSVRHHLFLVAKEALNNAAKYARASSVCLKIEVIGNLFRLMVTDDGCGFEIGRQHKNANGLRNMRERMAEIGGKCCIESGEGQGTRVAFELLFPNDNI
jgi:signal transduction histidine kinase/ligand-binding sensor domain-containing protein